MKEEVSTSVALASHSPSDGAAPAEPHGMAFGKPYFNVDGDTFYKARLGREKGKRWHSFIGKNDTVDAIRAYARKNGNPDIFLRHKDNGTFLFAQKGVGNGRKGKK